MKLVKELTLKEYKYYCNKRACDGNWSMLMASTCISFMHTLPKKKFFESKKKYDLKCEAYFKENIDSIWNLKDYPNMKLDIETGRFEL